MEARREMAHGGETGVFHDHRRVEGSPRVRLEPPAEHVPAIGPIVIGVQGGVGGHQAFAVIVHEGQERGLIRRRRSIAGGIDERDGVEPVDIVGFAARGLFGDPLPIGPDLGIPEAGLLAQFPEGGHGVGGRAVVETAGLADHQKVLPGDRRGSAAAGGKLRIPLAAGSRGQGRFGPGRAKPQSGEPPTSVAAVESRNRGLRIRLSPFSRTGGSVILRPGVKDMQGNDKRNAILV